MSQHDYNLANQSGADFRTDLNNALSAIASNNSGASEPSTTFAYEWWIDSGTGVLKLRNAANSAWITMPFSISSDNTVDINGGTVNGITSLSFSSGATVASILDEDNLSSDSATALATQQSIKAYVDSQVTAQDLDISDGSSTIAIDLDSETLSLLGGTGVTSTASGNGVTFAIGQSVATSDNVQFNQVTAALVGNASTATALATARTISGVSFDGTANITLDTDDIGEGSSNKYFTAERVDDQVNTLLTAGTGITLTYNDGAGTLTIDGQTGDITSVVAGDGLTGGGTSGDVTLTVGVDDSSIEINSDALRVKASGITNAMLGGSIANAKLANSSITINSQAIALGGSHTFDTDDIGEGSSNLYYTTARANSAIDSRVTNTFINDLTGVVADTATALATGRTIALSGDVTATGVSFDGTGNISLSTTIAANSVALGTDTTGNYVATIAGTTNEVEVSGSGSETAAVTIGLPDNVTIAGNLTVNGTTTTVNTSTLEVEDPLIKLAKSNSGADSVDIGFYGLYDTSGSQDLYAGLFRDASDSGKFKLFKDLQAEPTTTVNTSGTGYAGGTLVATFEGSLTGNVTGQVSTLSNHDTDNLSEGSSNLYFTNARARSAISASGDISYNSSTGVISFTQSTAPVTSVNSATGAVVLDTDDIAEGSNLYMTTERVQDIAGGMVTGNTETGITVTYDDSDGTLDFVVGTLNQDTTGNAATATALETARTIGGVSFDGTGNIDLAGVNTSGNQDTSGNAATATALAAGRTIGMTGDVVWTSASFDGSGNVTGTATIQANSVALGTDTTGDYVSTITAGTGLTSTGATSGEGVAHSLSVDAAQTQITSVGTLTSLTVDDITINGSTISDGGDLTIDVAGDIILDADGDNIFYKAGGSSFYSISNVSGDTYLGVEQSNKDLIIRGNDDGTAFTALTLDMSNAGAATFNDLVDAKNFKINGGQGSDGQVLTSTGSGVAWEDAAGGVAGIVSSANATAITIDASERVLIGSDSGDAFNDDAMFRLQRTGDRLFQSFKVDADQEAAIFFGDVDDDVECGIRYQAANRALEFSTGNNAEAMRIDSSGNFMVGTTSALDSDSGRGNITVNGSSNVILNFGVGGSQKGYIYHTGTNMKISNAANGIMQFQTNDTERMRINSTGEVGIGATSPDTLLHLSDGAGGAILRLERNDTTISDTNVYGGIEFEGQDASAASAAGVRGKILGVAEGATGEMALSFETAGGYGSSTERMRIDSSGNVVVGHTSAILSASNRGNVTINGANEAILSLGIGGSEGGYLYHDGTTQYLVNTKNGGLRFFTNNAEKMQINSTGEVGIGVTPVAHYTGYRALDIGTAMSLFSNSGGTNVATMTNNGYLNSSASQWTYKVTDEATMYSQVHGDHRFSTAVSGSAGGAISWLEKMRLNASGQLLIGQTAAVGSETVLQASGSDRSGGVVGFYDTDASTSIGNIILRLAFTNDNDCTNASFIHFADGDGTIGSVYAGNATSVVFSTVSDERLKENIVDASSQLQLVKDIKVREFDWKKDGTHQVGFIAQELNNLVPEAVAEGGEDVKENAWGVDYGKLTPYLVKAIQEQQTQIDALQSEINLLKGE